MASKCNEREEGKSADDESASLRLPKKPKRRFDEKPLTHAHPAFDLKGDRRLDTRHYPSRPRSRLSPVASYQRLRLDGSDECSPIDR